MLTAIKRSGAIQHTALLGAATTVGTMAIGLVALTVMENFEDTPEIRGLSCALEIRHVDCPVYGKKLGQLEEQIAGLRSEKNEIEDRLSSLSAIERSVEKVTFFEKRTDPHSGFKITIGTVYRTLTTATPQPEHHFCYVNLPDGAAGEDRSLRFHKPSGPVSVSRDTLNKTGLNEAVLAFGQSVCKPYLIGESA